MAVSGAHGRALRIDVDEYETAKEQFRVLDGNVRMEFSRSEDQIGLRRFVLGSRETAGW